MEQTIVALRYRDIIHKTKSRTVMGFKLKGGRMEVHTVARMVPVGTEILKRFRGPLRDFKKAIGRYRQISNGIPNMPSSDALTERMRRVDIVFFHLQFVARFLFVVTGSIGYYFYGGWRAAVTCSVGGAIFGFLILRSMGIRSRNPTMSWVARMRERAEGSRRGLLELIIEKARGREFTRATCREFTDAYDDAVKKFRACTSDVDRKCVLEELDKKIKRISYGLPTNCEK